MIDGVTFLRSVREGRPVAIGGRVGVVGAGGLGQMLAFHMGLFQMSETGSVLVAMLLLVALVDLLSYVARRMMMR